MVRKATQGEVVYLYDAESERGNARFAFRAVRFKNPTDSTLEAGPVTVYGEERFIGEGLTEPVPPSASAVVPYALDRQIVVERNDVSDDQIQKLSSLSRGILTAEVQHVYKRVDDIEQRMEAIVPLLERLVLVAERLDESIAPIGSLAAKVPGSGSRKRRREASAAPPLPRLVSPSDATDAAAPDGALPPHPRPPGRP